MNSTMVWATFSWSLNNKFYRGRTSSLKSRRRQMNGFPQDPNLHSWKPPKAVVIPHGSPAHLRSGIKRENAISKKANHGAGLRHPRGSRGQILYNSKASSEITQRGEPRLTSDLHRRSRKNRLPKIHQKNLFSHFPIFLYIFPKVDFDGKSRVVESPMSINEGLAGLHGSREYSQSVPRAISV